MDEAFPPQLEGNTLYPSDVLFRDQAQPLGYAPNLELGPDLDTQLDAFDITANFTTITDNLQPYEPGEAFAQSATVNSNTMGMAQSYYYLDTSVQPSETPTGILDQHFNNPSVPV